MSIPLPRVLLAWFLSVAGMAADLTIMPMGDSVTYGTGSPETSPPYSAEPTFPLGYRGVLQDRLAAAGTTFDFVGTVSTSGGQAAYHTHYTASSPMQKIDYDCDCEGHPGNEISDLRDKLIATMTVSTHTPSAVLLMIGINDINHGNSAGMNDRLRDLLTTIYMQGPSTRILLATIIAAADSPSITAYDDYIRTTEVPYWTGQGKAISMVDIAAAMSGGDRASLFETDGIHPSAAGYSRMADAWLNAGLVIIPAAPQLSPAGGTYAESVTVSITATDSSDVIHYTLDGSSPDAASPTYASPLTFSSDQEVKAVSMRGSSASAITSATYVITSQAGSSSSGSGSGSGSDSGSGSGSGSSAGGNAPASSRSGSKCGLGSTVAVILAGIVIGLRPSRFKPLKSTGQNLSLKGTVSPSGFEPGGGRGQRA